MVGGTRCLQRGVRVRFLEQPQPPAGLLLAVIASSTCICHHALMQALTLPSHGLIVHRGTASTRSQRAQSSDQWPMCNICHGGYRRRLGCSALQTPAQCSIVQHFGTGTPPNINALSTVFEWCPDQGHLVPYTFSYLWKASSTLSGRQ